MASSSNGRNCSGSRRIEHYSHLIFFFCFHLQVLLVSTNTYDQDAAALDALATLWEHTPSNWKGYDPCGDNWVGITCNNTRITQILLSSLGLEGTLSGDLTSLTELQILDLSYNKGFTGGLPESIGSLTKLSNLSLVGCSFSGEIPPEIGSLSRLIFLGLNSNKFTGSIPSTIGNLSNLYWLDLSDNQLTGAIPVKPGLDSLNRTKHFHFGINQLSGPIPSDLFSSNMQLIHLLLDHNKLIGSIPSALGLVNTLEVLRLDNNSLSGPVPSNISNLTRVAALHLANNQLTGPLPDLTGMRQLSFVDMGNNAFDESDAPPWFSNLPSLTSLYLESSNIGGQIPPALFSIPQLQTVKLKHNHFNGTLDVSTGYSSQLKLIDLQDNDIENITVGPGGFSNDIILVGNPFCDQGENLLYCKVQQQSPTPYPTPTQSDCMSISCPSDMALSPNCHCAYPYTGTFYLIAPSYSDFQNLTYNQILKEELEAQLLSRNLPVDSVFLSSPSVNSENNLQMNLQVFPSGKIRFNEREVVLLGFILSNQFRPNITIFGPFYFIGQAYIPEPVIPPSKSNSLPVIAGAAAGGAALVLLLIGCAAFAVVWRRKAKKTVQQQRSCGSWNVAKSSSSTPQLKGARCFSFYEVKKYTNKFSQANEIGNGGYGMVYKGVLPNGQLVAVKRAQEGSAQGEMEFNTEVELLSRVHHKNLVSLVGFCFDLGEQILVYDYVPNGTVKESLSGKSGVQLDWKRRLRVALGTARGLAYLHELANPPIVHRDVKSSNVLLDDNLDAKVSDFGLSKPLGKEKTHISTQVKGTMGYMDPEYYMTQQLTEKSDVYSFGVLLLELLTAKRPIEHGRYVVQEVRNMMDRSKDLYGILEILDPVLGLGNKLPGLEKFVELALLCVEESGIDRPAMSEVVKEIESIMQLASINLMPDSASYSTTSSEISRSSDRPHSNAPFDYSGTASTFSQPEPK